jgi:hypothetical protein
LKELSLPETFKIFNFILTNSFAMLRFKKFMQSNFQLAESEWIIIEPFIEEVILRKYDYFVREGKVCRRMGFIAEGVLRYCMNRAGEDITCYFVCEDNFAGDPDSFLSHKPSDKNMQALTDCVLFGFTYDNYKKMEKSLLRFPEIAGSISQRVMMDLLMQRDFLQQADALTKYKEFISKFPHILQRVPLSYVASFLGIAQQSLSRLRRQIL